MGTEPPVRREEARAALAARRELGEEYEDALVESFAQRIEERLAARVPAPARGDDRGRAFVLGLVSLGCGIPITAIALGSGGVPALVVAWLGIVLVNAVVARAR